MTSEEEKFYETEDLVWIATVAQPVQKPTPCRTAARKARASCGAKLLCLGVLLCAAVWLSGLHRRPWSLEVSAQRVRGLWQWVLELRPWEMTRKAVACVVGVTAMLLCLEPPTGQLASGAMLGALLTGRRGLASTGVLGAIAGAVIGALLGATAAVMLFSAMVHCWAWVQRRCCRCAEGLASASFVLASMLPAFWLAAVLLRLT